MKYSYKMSVVIPVHNAEKYLDACLKSVITQTMKQVDYEILLINDGSKDSSEEICKNWESNYSNLSYYWKENSGVSDTRNLGLNKSKGKYILFLDSDDYLSPSVLEKVYLFFEKNDSEIDLVTYPIMYVNTKGKKTKHFRYQELYKKGTGIYDLDEHYECIQTTINVCVKNDRKHYFDSNQSFSEDEKFNTSVIMSKRKIGYVHDVYYFYRRHDSNVTKDKSNLLKNFQQINDYYREILATYDRHPYVQNLLLNQIRFRIEDGNLYSNTEEKKEIAELLKFIDLKYLHEMSFLDDFHKLYILDFMGKKIQIDITESINSMCDGISFLKEENVNIMITNIETKDNQVRMSGTIFSNIFSSSEKIICIAEMEEQNGRKIVQELTLTDSNLSYHKSSLRTNIFKEITLSFDIRNVREIRCYLEVGGKKLTTCFLPSTFIPAKISLGKKKMILGDKIRVTKNSFLPGYPYTSWKMYLLHFLKHFYYPFKKIELYVEKEKGIIYKEYQKENGESKKFYFNNIHSLKYQLLILKCKKLMISDFHIHSYLPFGKNNNKYSSDYQYTIFYYCHKEMEVEPSYMGREFHRKAYLLGASEEQKQDFILKGHYSNSAFRKDTHI